ncbi:MAG: DUF1656 domain-containing protein [Pseudomonadota bacterium]
MNKFPHELAMGDVYMSPMLPVCAAALLATWLTTLLMNRLSISRYVAYPSATFLTILTAFILLLDSVWIRV